MRTDIRNAVRGLLRTPTVTGSAILCLTLGLGATTAIASAIDRALVKPLPFRAPDGLLTVYRTAPQANDWPTAPAKYLDVARAINQLSGLAATAGFGTGLLTIGDRTDNVSTVRATGNLFPMLGVVSARGRLFTPTDDSAGSDPVAVLSDELWKRDFNADPSLIGRTMRLDGTARTVIGILPPDFFCRKARTRPAATSGCRCASQPKRPPRVARTTWRWSAASPPAQPSRPPTKS